MKCLRIMRDEETDNFVGPLIDLCVMLDATILHVCQFSCNLWM